MILNSHYSTKFIYYVTNVTNTFLMLYNLQLLFISNFFNSKFFKFKCSCSIFFFIFSSTWTSTPVSRCAYFISSTSVFKYKKLYQNALGFETEIQTRCEIFNRGEDGSSSAASSREVLLSFLLNHFGIRATTLLTDFSGYLIFLISN